MEENFGPEKFAKFFRTKPSGDSWLAAEANFDLALCAL
jgi:hypothetical protein